LHKPLTIALIVAASFCLRSKQKIERKEGPALISAAIGASKHHRISFRSSNLQYFEIKVGKNQTDHTK